MTGTGHTPAPWRAYHAADDRWIVDQPGPNGLHVVYCGPGTNLYSAANARLIAAAPDLLAAMLRIVSEYESGSGLDLRLADIARAAIAKAEQPQSAPSCERREHW